MDEKGLGKHLQKMRRQAGLTQQQLCQKANLSFSTLTKIERGAIRNPSIFTIKAIASAMELSLDELLGDKKTTNRSLGHTRSGVEFVYFDVNGCLLRFYHRAFAQIAKDYSVPPDLVEMAFLHFNSDACKGSLTMEDFNSAVADKLAISSINWPNYYFAAVEPMPGMSEIVTWAKQHYGVGLLTNIMPGLLPMLINKKIIPDLPYDQIIDSSQIGLIKPDEAIFNLACSRANLPAEKILLIDDTRENVAVAEKLGWHVLWFDYSQPNESVDQVKMALELAN